MKNSFLNRLSVFLFALLCISSNVNALNPLQSPQYFSLYRVYEAHRAHPSDINEHLPTLRKLASECTSVVEMGAREMVSTWGILLGLAENSNPKKFYLGVDLVRPPQKAYSSAKQLVKSNKISFQFWQLNDLHMNIESADMLFIDTLHTYAQLTTELERFSPTIRKYIAMHGTSEPWGDNDEPYEGDYSEYPAHIDRTKRGLWTAVEDFLKTHPEWTLHERYINNLGLTVLMRISD